MVTSVALTNTMVDLPLLSHVNRIVGLESTLLAQFSFVLMEIHDASKRTLYNDVSTCGAGVGNPAIGTNACMHPSLAKLGTWVSICIGSYVKLHARPSQFRPLKQV
jgi:hypothetical protein